MELPWQKIGTVKSVFQYKNGTPRQPTLCETARGVITIDKSVFNNPEHSLEGLDQFSHAWILFIFHKNNNAHTKAKVKPPRLNGGKVGVFSSRSPYRPNNIGLSLVNIDRVEGASVFISGIDILDGTPVVDIKPYIPDYDQPKAALTYRQSACPTLDGNSLTESSDAADEKIGKMASSFLAESQHTALHSKPISTAKNCSNTSSPASCLSPGRDISNLDSNADFGRDHDFSCSGTPQPEHNVHKCPLQKTCLEFKDNGVSSLLTRSKHELNFQLDKHKGESNYVEGNVLLLPPSSESDYVEGNVLLLPPSTCGNTCDIVQENPSRFQEFNDESEAVPEGYKSKTCVASWLLQPPVSRLQVTFTSQAIEQLHMFSRQSCDLAYQLQLLLDPEEAYRSICDVLREDPRSVYRRQQCPDSLYYFSLDVLHVTCWFDDNVAQVVRVKPVSQVPELSLV